MKYSKKIQSIIQSLDDVVKIAEGTAAQDLLANMSVRIFNIGKDAKGKSIGRYSPEYAEMREAAGLQTTYVDLTFTTDLRNSIVQNENRVGFKNQYGIEIANRNEEHFNRKIFEPSSDERERAIDIMRDEFNKLYSK